MPNPKEPSPQETYMDVKKCLQAVNKEGKDEFGNKLQLKPGILAKIRFWIFLNPSKFLILGNIFWGSIIIVAILLIPDRIDNQPIRLILFLVLFLFYLAITILLDKIIPRYSMEFDQRWSLVVSKYVYEKQIDLRKAKRRLKRAISYYQRKGSVAKDTVNLFWGGIIVSCVSSDVKFQEALLKMSLWEMFNLNLFGTLCIVFLPFIYLNYDIKYGLPIAWTKNVLDQIEIEEI